MLALSVVLAACSSTDADPTTSTLTAALESTTTTAGSATTTAPTTTTVPATTTTAASGSELVLPDNFGDDYRYVWDEIQGFIDRMSIDPHADLTDLIIDPACSCYQPWFDYFTELESNNWRFSGEAFPVTESFQVLFVEENQVGIAITQAGAADAVIDEDGNLIREDDPWRHTSSVALARDEEGRWRISNVTSG